MVCRDVAVCLYFFNLKVTNFGYFVLSLQP